MSNKKLKESINLELEVKAKILYDIIEKRRLLDKQELELKTFFKQLINNKTSLELGDITIYKTKAYRSDLDKDKLKFVLGVNYKMYEKITEYVKLDVKKG